MNEDCLRLRFKVMFKNIHMQVQVLKNLQNKQPKNQLHKQENKKMTNKTYKAHTKMQKNKNIQGRKEKCRKKTYQNLKVDAHISYVLSLAQTGKGEVPSKRASLKLKASKQVVKQ